MKRIIIKGKSGQGIQRLGFILANLLKDKGYQVALTGEYGALVRAGNSQIKLVFAKEPIENPLVEKADLDYDLGNSETEKLLLKKYPQPQSLNMILLGVVLRRLNLEISAREVRPYLPAKFQQENLEAIQSGYQP